jgi:hypothetical protein
MAHGRELVSAKEERQQQMKTTPHIGESRERHDLRQVHTPEERKPTVGRRTLLTAELQRDICAFVRAGAYDYAAAEACGISRRAFFEWLERGERESKRGRAPVYVQFARAIRRAQAQARVSAEVTVKKVDPKWWLSRMHRERPDAPGWNDTRSVEVTGKDGNALIPITLARQIIDLVESGDGE